MPGKKRSLKNGGLDRNSIQSSISFGSSIEKIRGRTFLTLSTGTTVAPLQPSATYWPRLQVVADVFQFYRFVALKVYLPPSFASAGSAANTAANSVAYANGTFDSPPASFAACAELPYFQFSGPAETHTRTLTIGRQELLSDNPTKWWKTQPGTPETGFEVQGNLYFSQEGTCEVYVEYEVELTSWNLTGQSPMPRYELIDSKSNLYRKVDSSTDSSPGMSGAVFGTPPRKSKDDH